MRRRVDEEPGEAARLVRNLQLAPVRAVIFVIQLYRHMVSPLRLPSCRFLPTCSQYAVEALREYGLIRGGWLSAVRLAKCGPWHPGGWDPIPECTRDHAHDGDARAALRLPANRAERESVV